MILQFNEEQKKLRKKKKAHNKTVHRYLRDVAASLPCTQRQKRTILSELQTLIHSHTGVYFSRTALEEIFGTPKEIADTYIGDSAVSFLRRSKLQHRILLFTVLPLLFIALITAVILFASPMVYYTESITVLENETDSVYLTFPYAPQAIAAPRTGIKTVTCHDHRGRKLWTATIRGTFGYIYSDIGQALTAECTITLHDKEHLIVTHKDFLIPDAAVSIVTAKNNGFMLEKKVMLTCDRFGNLS